MLTELVATLARLLTRGGNRVGAVLYDNAVERIIEPRSGRNQVLRIARDLLRPPAASGADDRPRAASSAPRLQRDPPAFARVRDLRLHQRTGVGARARAARAAPRGGGGPHLGPA